RGAASRISVPAQEPFRCCSPCCVPIRAKGRSTLRGMRIVLSDFMSLDGVVQAPGGKEEDTDGGFQHGGWSMPYFDPESMGAAVDEAIQGTDALLFGR